MTAKRFEYYEHKGADYILDTPNKSLDFIEMLGDCLEAEEIVDLLNELHEENEQLKAQLKDYHNAFDCSQCRYQNYDWFDDGDEFEVCDKGNNEAQMEYHSCKDWEEL